MGPIGGLMEALAMRLLGFYERQGEMIIWGCRISQADVIICADKDIKRKQMHGVLKKWQMILSGKNMRAHATMLTVEFPAVRT